MTQPPPLRILLIGHGRFGREHHSVWDRLAADGLATLAGIVVNTEASRAALAATTAIPVYRGLDGIDWNTIDAVDIVTPSHTHADLVRSLLPLAHVMVEKPLATSPEDADALARLAAQSSKLLAVGHIYRFHPLIAALRKIVESLADRPSSIFGTFLNPIEEAPPGAEPNLEFLHYFDIIDLLFGVAPTSCTTAVQGRTSVVSLRYPLDPQGAPSNAVLRLGWEGGRRRRMLELLYPDRGVQVDLIEQLITVELADSMHRVILPHGNVALEAELRDFVGAIRQHRAPAVDGRIGARIVGIASRARPAALKRRPLVAVIGGGIFGATCAAELGGFCDVTLIERHDELLAEASSLNQWRFHHGFHYPRSIEMIGEIQESRHEFEAVYSRAIITDLPSYYATARAGRVITGERFLHVCTSMGLQFTQESPPPDVLNPALVSLCLRTWEGVVDATILREIVRERLAAHRSITVLMGHEVVDGSMLPDGRKRLVMRHGSTRHAAAFDYVVNATYVNRNLLAGLFGFVTKPLRFDRLELLRIRLDLPKMSVTVLDAPFTSLVSTGTDKLFTLSHIQHSLLATATPADGMPPVWDGVQSNRENILRQAQRYMPVLRDAEYIDSRYGTRAVHALPQDLDGRPTVVVDHGFGCWSILGGKINTSVSNARQIAFHIATQQGIEWKTGPVLRGGIADEGEEWRDRSPVGAQRR